MRGAIAAGHPLTAEAGARILAEGGNAVDACVAAAFASWVAESPLTGPGAGGFMLVHRARDRSTRLLDFFVAVARARRGRAPAVPRWSRSTSTSTARRRRSSASAPARAPSRARRPGLEAAHRALRDAALADAVRAGARARPRRRRADAAAGVPARDPRPDPPAHRPRAGASTARAARASAPATGCVLADLGDDARATRAEGAAALYGGELGRGDRPRTCATTGGAVTAADLAAYRVIRRRPVRCAFRGARVRLEPAAVVRRRADRLRAAAARPARPSGAAGSAEAIARSSR